MAIYTLKDKQFGTITLHTRKGMRSMAARWENGQLRLNVPEGATIEWINNMLNPMRDRIEALNRRTINYHIGQIIHCYGFTITITAHNEKPGRYGYGGKGNELYVTVSKLADFNSQTTNKTISACISKLMSERADSKLIPRAIEVAKSLNINHKNFVIGRGVRKLGHCTTKGEIQLSRNLIFFPEHLIDYVIFHELAHLTHHNHSAEFHALCNSYCNGRERELNKEMKHFKLPIIP